MISLNREMNSLNREIVKKIILKTPMILFGWSLENDYSPAQANTN